MQAPTTTSFFNDTATAEIYTPSLHDALPISTTSPPYSSAAALRGAPWRGLASAGRSSSPGIDSAGAGPLPSVCARRSEEHTSELQSRQYLVCRLLLEKKKNFRHAATVNATEP